MISNKTDYALRLLANLAQKRAQGLLPSRQIAEEEEIPLNFMPQIVSALVKKGWVESVRGPGGGVKLAVQPHQIAVSDVIDFFKELQVRHCLQKPDSCGRSDNCYLRRVLQKAEQEMIKVLQTTTIDDLLRPEF
jgi:Rrf2 family nitric oxide-sensitive transcriptional repressor